MYKSKYQNKQHLMMNGSFAVYIRVVIVLIGFGADQCLGLKIVSYDVNQVIPLLFYFLWMQPVTFVTVFRRSVLNCKIVLIRSWSFAPRQEWVVDFTKVCLILLVLEVPITKYCENSRMHFTWYRDIFLKHRQLGRERKLYETPWMLGWILNLLRQWW